MKMVEELRLVPESRLVSLLRLSSTRKSSLASCLKPGGFRLVSGWIPPLHSVRAATEILKCTSVEDSKLKWAYERMYDETEQVLVSLKYNERFL